MKQKFVSALSPEAITPDNHFCKEIYCIFFQPEILTGELEKSFIKNFKGGKNVSY